MSNNANNVISLIKKNYKVEKITRTDENVRMLIENEYLDYDHVVLATHADQSLKMLSDPTDQEQNILSKFKYVNNTAILHNDLRLMPKKKLAWSSWNSISNKGKTCVTYRLNKLQNLNSEKRIIESMIRVSHFMTQSVFNNIRIKTST